MLKGRKQKFSERFPAHEMKATIPVLMSTPLAARLKKLADEIKYEHNTRRNNPIKEKGEEA